MTKDERHHATIDITRHYKVTPSRLFEALTNPEARRKWYLGGSGWTVHAASFDSVTCGATEHSRMSPPGNLVEITNDMTWCEVVPDRRLVSTFYMTLDGDFISASVQTLSLKKVDGGTELHLLEQGVFNDPDMTGREAGTHSLLESLGTYLESANADQVEPV